MPHRKRRDTVQAEIVSVLRQLDCSVLDLSQLGGGCPDILVSKWRGNTTLSWTVLAEIKSPKGKLRTGQHEFAACWQGRIYVLRSVEDAIRMVEELRDIRYIRRLVARMPTRGPSQ